MGSTNYWPDNTVTEFYIPGSSLGMYEILEMAQLYWGPDITIEDLNIQAEHIQTSCLTYDLHDPSDYTTFLCISKKGA